jgi:HPt (histidine-containing phosphotransfer) domain-containing protein
MAGFLFSKEAHHSKNFTDKTNTGRRRHVMTNLADKTSMGPSSSDRHPDAVDWSVLDALKTLQKPGRPDVCNSLMAAYLSSSPSLFEDARTAITARDGQALMNAAHSMKSSSMAIGAKTFGKTCLELEILGRSNQCEDAFALLRQAECQFAAVCCALRDALEMT